MFNCFWNPIVRDSKVVDTDALLAAIRSELVSTSAVSPEDVEPVDLADYPGLEGIKEDLERNVLFPLEKPWPCFRASFHFELRASL